MNKIIVFILGFIAGVIVLMLSLLIFGVFKTYDKDFSSDKIQYVEIEGCNGEVTLHTQMPKDSVKLLVGKPTSISLRTLGDDAFESWFYEFSSQGRILSIEFINGKLESIH